MSEIVDIITRLSYVAEDAGLKKSTNLILEQTKQIELLTKERIELAKKQSELSSKDIAQQKQISEQIRRLDQAIKEKTRSVIQERVASTNLNKELVKEIGLLANIEQKMTALKNQRAMATTAGEVKKLTKEIAVLDAEMKGLLMTTSSKTGGGAGGIFSALLGGFGFGAATFGLASVAGSLSNFFQTSLRESEEAELGLVRFKQTLDNIGRGDLFDELTAQADDLAKSYKNLFDNDDILAGQTKFIEGTKITKTQLEQLIPVAIELAAKLGTDVTTASEMLVNSIIGRTSPELKRLGLNMKDVKTETERVNLIVGDFAKLLSGSVDSALTTTIGKTQQYNQEIANLEEDLGKKLTPLKRAWLQFQVDIISGLNYVLESADEKRVREINLVSDAYLKKYKDLTTEELKEKQRLNVQAAKYMFTLKKQIDDDELKLEEVNAGKRSIFEDQLIRNRIKENKDRLERGTRQITQTNIALTKLLSGKTDDGRSINKTGGTNEDPEIKTEKKKAEAKKKITKEYVVAEDALYKDLLDLIEGYHKLELLSLEQLRETEGIAEDEFKEEQIQKEIDFLDEKIQLNKMYGKETVDEERKRLEQIARLREQVAKRPAEKREPLTGEFMPGTTGDVSTIAPSAFDTDAYIQANNEKTESDEERAERLKLANEKIVSSFNSVDVVVQAVGNALSTATQAAIDQVDSQIVAQQGRIERAKKYAERGGAELLEIEEERLNKLNQKRQEFAQQQLIINNALALSNAILAVATAAGETGVGAIAAVPAVLAVIASGYALATSLTEPQQLAEGTKSVKGPGTETSDSIPARLSVNERVVKASTSKRFKGILDDIQDGKFKSEHDLFSQIRGGRYGPNSLNYSAILESKSTSNTKATERLLVDINSTLERVNETIADKPVAMLTADESGLHAYYMKMQRVQQKRDRY